MQAEDNVQRIKMAAFMFHLLFGLSTQLTVGQGYLQEYPATLGHIQIRTHVPLT